MISLNNAIDIYTELYKYITWNGNHIYNTAGNYEVMSNYTISRMHYQTACTSYQYYILVFGGINQNFLYS